MPPALLPLRVSTLCVTPAIQTSCQLESRDSTAGFTAPLARPSLGKAEWFPPGWATGHRTICKSICNVSLTQCLPGASSEASRHKQGWDLWVFLSLLTPIPFLCRVAYLAHVQCNNQTLGLQRAGGGLSAWEPSHWNSKLPQDTHSHQRQLSMPECQWQLQRSCRCRPPRCPSSPPPRRTGARCKAPWSARAWIAKRSRQQRFQGNPWQPAQPCKLRPRGRMGMQEGRMGMAKGTGESPAKSKGQAPRCWWEQGDTVRPHTHRDQSTPAPTAPHLLCHHADFDTKDTGLLFGWGPLQAHVPACELHGEFHLDLWETGGESWLA